jgi:uncharacterized protein YndB with AHSA1/START domain
MFRREINSEIEISASPEAVWGALTDFEAFRDWNPFIRPVVGEAKEGTRLRVQMRPPGGRRGITPAPSPRPRRTRPAGR